MINISISENEIIAGLISVIVFCFFFNPLSSLGTKIHDSLTKEEVFIPTKRLAIKDDLLIQMLNENGIKISYFYIILYNYQN